MSKSILAAISGIISPVIENLGIQLVDVEFKKEYNQWVLRVFIDRDGGVRLQDCELISREIEPVLDVEDPVDQPYTLEVSSPGLRRPLKKQADYDRFRGELAKIKLFTPLDGKKVFHAYIKGIEDDEVIVDRDGEVIRIPLARIARANLEPE